MIQSLFSYGTLQYKAVQLKTFGRELVGENDAIVGYKLDRVQITDPEVIRLSGESIHNMLIPTGNQHDTVSGVVFEVTSEELAHADQYEVSAYVRKKVPLLSGKMAWAYVSADAENI